MVPRGRASHQEGDNKARRRRQRSDQTNHGRMDLNSDSDDKGGGAPCNDSDDRPLDDLSRRGACEARGSDRSVCHAVSTAGAPSCISDDKDGPPPRQRLGRLTARSPLPAESL